MDGGIVQHHNRQRHPLLALCDTVDQFHDGFAPEGRCVHIMPYPPVGVIQSAHDMHPFAREAGIGRVRFALGRPCPLDVGNSGETAFVPIKPA
jgi:hypothetical protein